MKVNFQDSIIFHLYLFSDFVLGFNVKTDILEKLNSQANKGKQPDQQLNDVAQNDQTNQTQITAKSANNTIENINQESVNYNIIILNRR